MYYQDKYKDEEHVVFRRKIMDQLVDWKKSGLCRRKALVIKGLRQIGKTFIVREFARSHYAHEAYINFKNNESAKRVFDGDLKVDRLIMDLSALMPGVRFVPGKTLIIFDEVQECANARAALKPIIEDGRFDVVCTGSLLGIKGYNRKQGKGIPTGFERILYMKPMDFEEFCWAKGLNDEIFTHIRQCYDSLVPVSQATHRALLRYFREYLCVGGLPAVVDVFVHTSDMGQVRQEQLDIIEEYKDDFGKHLDENEREKTDLALLARINRVFDSIPAQLAKENKKFQYSKVEKKGRSDTYQAAIQWLVDSGMISLCHNLSIPQSPLEGNKEDNAFKIYFQDSGLFVAMLEEGSVNDILSGDMGIYKGAIYENVVADAFSKKGWPLYYFRKDSGLEIDFVSRVAGKVALIEVKATTGNTKSADTVLKNRSKYGVDRCYKLGEYNVGASGNKITLPYYMAFLLEP